ncbi:MAG: hypothetical protein II723_01640 [Oscillospiraceae bacterium]|nr:hypothetical protein [Oscillospiraceae bacterium]
MWLKRQDTMYNLDRFDTVTLDYDYETNRYFFVLVSAVHENRDHEVKIGPFPSAKAKGFFSEFVAALKSGIKIWEFPEEPEQ